MIINTTAANSIPKEDLDWFSKIHSLFHLLKIAREKHKIGAVPDTMKRILDKSLECHTIATIVSMMFKEIKLVHGVYGGINHTSDHPSFTTCAHSWNMTPSGTIIDSYPVGIITGGPVIVVSHGMYKDFGKGLYIPKPEIVVELPLYKIWSRAVEFTNLLQYTQGNFLED